MKERNKDILVTIFGLLIIGSSLAYSAPIILEQGVSTGTGPSTVEPSSLPCTFDLSKIGAAFFANDCRTGHPRQSNTDPDALIQWALDNLPTGGGGVHINDGSWSPISPALDVPSNAYVWGNGPATIIDVTSTNQQAFRNKDRINGNANIHISNLKITGPNPGSILKFSHGIQFYGVTDFLLEDLWITGFGYQAIFVTTGGTIDANNQVTPSPAASKNGIIQANNLVSATAVGGSIAIAYGNSIIINDNYLKAPDATISIVPLDIVGAQALISDIIISNNISFGAGTSGGFVDMTPGANSLTRRIKVMGNSFFDHSGAVRVYHQGTNKEITDITICDNTSSTGANAPHIWITGGTRTLICNNFIKDGSLVGIKFDKLTTAPDNLFNIIIGNFVGSQGDTGINVTNFYHGVISDNGIYDNNADNNPGGSSWGNTVGIALGDTSQDNVISGNRIRGSLQKNAIWEQSSLENFNLITDNDVRGNVAGINVTGASTIVRNNLGYITENWGATSVADGGTISHGLAGTPDTVTVTCSVAGEICGMTALSATTFTVSVKKNDGTVGTTQTVYWSAVFIP